MPKTYAQIADVLSLTVDDARLGAVVKNWGSPGLKVLGNAEGVVLDHLDDGSVVKLTPCQGTVAFLEALRGSPVVGLPVVEDAYGVVGTNDHYGDGNPRDLFAFRIQKCAPLKPSQKGLCAFADRMSGKTSDLGMITDSTKSAAVIRHLQREMGPEIDQAGFAAALDFLHEFFSASPEAGYVLDLNKGDWMLSGDQLVHVDPIAHW